LTERPERSRLLTFIVEREEVAMKDARNIILRLDAGLS
jgi:hypothetical protein